MFQQKREAINIYEGTHFLVKLRAVKNVENENISFSAITRSAEATTWGVLWKKLLFKITQYSQEKDWVRVTF